MESCDVLVVGGGPAGSTCAWRLREAGFDVIVVDGAVFPRDKVCAGWVTPQALTDLQLDVDEYRRERTFQAFTGFRVGLLGREPFVDTLYGHAVSFGIRRCEFDDYLLRRAGARLRLGTRISTIARTGRFWAINDRYRAPVLVGAGGHFCPVARLLNASRRDLPLVVAQEAEFAIAPCDVRSLTTVPEVPELYFSPALNGYGWCVRKQHYINVGFGQTGGGSLRIATAAFAAFLEDSGRIRDRKSCHWKGHAYLLASAARRIVGDGILLAGDAAGLAYPQSGEGIRPAIESGLIAAAAIIDARGVYGRERLGRYEDQVRRRFGTSRMAAVVSQMMPQPLVRALSPWMLRAPWIVRHLVLDRWFLHADQPALAGG
jgi:flavin-dependent dehydrogenase